jgi:hypothetical protein
MSFREKSAWISFLTVLLATVVFFSARFFITLNLQAVINLMIGCVVGLILLQALLTWLAARLGPPDARGPNDEREQAIQLRSFRVGYYVLVVSVVAMFFTGHATFSAHLLLFHALGALIVSTLSISLAQIIMFRLDR